MVSLKCMLYPDPAVRQKIGRNLSQLDQITPNLLYSFYKCCHETTFVESVFDAYKRKFNKKLTYCNCQCLPKYLKYILENEILNNSYWCEITITIDGKKTLYNTMTNNIVSTKGIYNKPLRHCEWEVQCQAFVKLLNNFKCRLLEHTNYIMIFEKQDNGNIHAHVALNMHGIKMGFDEFSNDLKKYLKSKTHAHQHSITTVKYIIKWYKYIFKNIQAYDYIRNNGDILRSIVEENKIKSIDIIYNDETNSEDQKTIL